MDVLLNAHTWLMIFAVLLAGVFIFRQPSFDHWHVTSRYLVAMFCLLAAIILYPVPFEIGMIQFLAAAGVVLTACVLLLDLFTDIASTVRQSTDSEKRLMKSLPDYLLEISQALGDLARTRTGALIVVERKDSLVGKVTGGVSFDAEVRQEVLVAIFSKTSPIHDGAVVISDGRIRKVKGILPLRTNAILPMGTGTRHRSGVSITEKTDAIALIASEERGTLSVAYRGKIVTAKSGKDFLKLVQRALKSRDITETD